MKRTASDDLPSQANDFADWVISEMSNTLYLANNMRGAAFDDRRNAVILLFSPDIEEDVDSLKEVITDRARSMSEEEMGEENRHSPTGTYKIRVDAQEVRVNRRTNLLLRVYNAGER